MNKLAHAPERKPAQRFLKPALAFAMAASLAFPIFAKAEKQSEPMELETRKAHVKLKKGEIESVIDSNSCRFYVLKENSTAIDKIADEDSQKLQGQAVTMGLVRNSDERPAPFVLTLIRSPKGDSFRELDIFKGISAWGKKETARIMPLKEANAEKSLAKLKKPQFLEPASGAGTLYAELSRTRPAAAKEVLGRAVESYYLGLVIDAHAPPSSSYFLQILGHEAIHCLLVTEDFRKGRTIPHGGSEAMAVMGEMAYGKNPWLSLRMLLEGYFPFETGGNWVLPRDRKEIDNFIKFHEILMRALKEALGVKSVSAIAFKSESQLRAGAEKVLDGLSKDFYGAPFRGLFKPEEIKSILEAAEKKY